MYTKSMNKHTIVTSALNIFVVLAAVVAWLQSTDGNYTLLNISSLLAVLAFGLMWVHYVSDAVAPLKEGDSPDVQYWVSRGAVLIAILAHPVLVNWYLLDEGYGFPPGSYESLLSGFAWVVVLGWIALAAFLLFEVRKHKLVARYERQIFHFNILAMFLVIIHGFMIGLVMMNTWYVWVWWAFLASFGAVAVYRYRVYYSDNPKRRSVALALVAALIVAGSFAGILTNRFTEPISRKNVGGPVDSIRIGDDDPQPSDIFGENTTSPTDISKDELAANDGREGRECWVAIDGVVYNASVSSEWQNGQHIPSGGQAKCGEDLSQVIRNAPHGRSVLSILPSIGNLQ